MISMYYCSNVVATLESEIERCISTLAIHIWFPNAYMEQYDVVESEGGVLIKTTSSPNAIAFVNHHSNGGNYAMVFG